MKETKEANQEYFISKNYVGATEDDWRLIKCFNLIALLLNKYHLSSGHDHYFSCMPSSPVEAAQYFL